MSVRPVLRAAGEAAVRMKVNAIRTTASESGSFGALLRRYRLAASLTQEALGERAQLSLNTVAALEHGRRTAPRPMTVVMLADALGLAPAERAAFIAAAAEARGVADSSSYDSGATSSHVKRNLPERAKQLRRPRAGPAAGAGAALDDAHPVTGWCGWRGQDPSRVARRC